MDVQELDIIKRRVLDRLLTRGGPHLSDELRAYAAAAYAERAHKIALWLHSRRDTVLGPDGPVECKCCSWQEGARFARYEFGAYVYDTPWETTGHELYFCSDECRDAYLYEGDFSYRYCEFCEREICGQNPMNGWHTQFRRTDDGDDICLSCYEADILEHGCSREKFEAYTLPGMFFSGDNHEPLEAGYVIVPGYDNAFIRDREAVFDVCNLALELMDLGAKVLCGYESMAIGGGEGYISLFVKGGPADLDAWVQARNDELFQRAVNGD